MDLADKCFIYLICSYVCYLIYDKIPIRNPGSGIYSRSHRGYIYDTISDPFCNGRILSFSSYLISASILSNLGAHLISYLIYGCGLVSSSRTFWYVPLHSDIIDDIT